MGKILCIKLRLNALAGVSYSGGNTVVPVVNWVRATKGSVAWTIPRAEWVINGLRCADHYWKMADNPFD